jgi:hypothetical protein
LHVACCLLSVACCVLSVAWCEVSVAWCVLQVDEALITKVDSRTECLRLVPLSQSGLPGLPHGLVLGTTKCGIVAYNCNYHNNPQAETSARAYDYSNFLDNGIFTGMKYQCVEFARRYWHALAPLSAYHHDHHEMAGERFDSLKQSSTRFHSVIAKTV